MWLLAACTSSGPGTPLAPPAPAPTSSVTASTSSPTPPPDPGPCLASSWGRAVALGEVEEIVWTGSAIATAGETSEGRLVLGDGDEDALALDVLPGAWFGRWSAAGVPEVATQPITGRVRMGGLVETADGWVLAGWAEGDAAVPALGEALAEGVGFAVRLDPDGVPVQLHRFTGTHTLESNLAVEVWGPTAAGEVLFGVSFVVDLALDGEPVPADLPEPEAWLVAVDGGGDVAWTWVTDGNAFPRGVAVAPDGTIAVGLQLQGPDGTVIALPGGFSVTRSFPRDVTAVVAGLAADGVPSWIVDGLPASGMLGATPDGFVYTGDRGVGGDELEAVAIAVDGTTTPVPPVGSVPWVVLGDGSARFAAGTSLSFATATGTPVERDLALADQAGFVSRVATDGSSACISVFPQILDAAADGVGGLVVGGRSTGPVLLDRLGPAPRIVGGDQGYGSGWLAGLLRVPELLPAPVPTAPPPACPEIGWPPASAPASYLPCTPWGAWPCTPAEVCDGSPDDPTLRCRNPCGVSACPAGEVCEPDDPPSWYDPIDSDDRVCLGADETPAVRPGGFTTPTPCGSVEVGRPRWLAAGAGHLAIAGSGGVALAELDADAIPGPFAAIEPPADGFVGGVALGGTRLWLFVDGVPWSAPVAGGAVGIWVASAPPPLPAWPPLLVADRLVLSREDGLVESARIGADGVLAPWELGFLPGPTRDATPRLAVAGGRLWTVPARGGLWSAPVEALPNPLASWRVDDADHGVDGLVGLCDGLAWTSGADLRAGPLPTGGRFELRPYVLPPEPLAIDAWAFDGMSGWGATSQGGVVCTARAE